MSSSNPRCVNCGERKSSHQEVDWGHGRELDCPKPGPGGVGRVFQAQDPKGQRIMELEAVVRRVASECLPFTDTREAAVRWARQEGQEHRLGLNAGSITFGCLADVLDAIRPQREDNNA